MPCAT